MIRSKESLLLKLICATHVVFTTCITCSIYYWTCIVPLFLARNFVSSFAIWYRPSKEHREELVKLAKAHAVKSKVSARKVREKAISTLRKRKSVSKDSIRRIENKVSFVALLGCGLSEFAKQSTTGVVKPKATIGYFCNVVYSLRKPSAL